MNIVADKNKEKIIMIERDIWDIIYDEVESEIRINKNKPSEIIPYNIATKVIDIIQLLVFGEKTPAAKKRYQIYQSLKGYNIVRNNSEPESEDTFIKVLSKIAQDVQYCNETEYISSGQTDKM